MTNSIIAQRLLNYARRLKGRQSNPYRARAYRLAAETIQRSERELADVLDQEGIAGLRALPHVGERLALTLERFLRTGEWVTLDVDPQQQDPGQSLCQLRGIGPRWAHRFEEQFGLTNVDDLLRAYEQGQLNALHLPQTIIRSLETARARLPETVENEPAIADLLEVDQRLRSELTRWNKADAESRDSSSPLVEMKLGEWTFQARRTSSALAQRLGRAQDWVMIHFDNGERSGERLVVTESRTFLRGQRVVRGRERECAQCVRNSR